MSDYQYIRAWGRMMGSFRYYVEDQVAKAKADKAPTNAIYYSDSDKRWHTADEIQNPDTKAWIEGVVK